MELSHWLIVIPARLDSQRLPNKPLANLGGKPMIVRVAENLAPLRKAGAEVVIATDAQQVVEVCQEHHISAELTSPHHQSGTDRCFEVASRRTQPFILNVQGDEPFLSIADVKALLEGFRQAEHYQMGTLAYLNSDPEDLNNPNVVKIARSLSGRALYFSRSPIPYRRDSAPRQTPQKFWHHIGIYAFDRQSLKEFCSLEPSSLEQTERLEQLRALEHDWNILVQPAKSLSLGIDTPSDLEVARERFSTT